MTAAVAPPENVLDCRTCGACCRAGMLVGATGATLGAAEWHQLTEPTVEDWECGSKRQMRRRDEHWGAGSCVALDRERGTRLYSCTVYDRRPKVCRVFEPGQQVCFYARRMWGLPIPPWGAHLDQFLEDNLLRSPRAPDPVVLEGSWALADHSHPGEPHPPAREELVPLGSDSPRCVV